MNEMKSYFEIFEVGKQLSLGTGRTYTKTFIGNREKIALPTNVYWANARIIQF